MLFSTMRFHFILLKQPSLKSLQIMNARNDVEKREPSYAVGRNANWWIPGKLYSQFSCSFMSDSLWHHGLQHASLPCPSSTPKACSNSCPSSWWCHPTISSSVIPFYSCLQSFPASGSFPMSQFFASGGQSIGVSVSAWVLPVNIQDWYPLGLTGWFSLQSKGLSRVFFKNLDENVQFFFSQLSLESKSHIHTWPLEKP